MQQLDLANSVSGEDVTEDGAADHATGGRRGLSLTLAELVAGKATHAGADQGAASIEREQRDQCHGDRHGGAGAGA